MAASLCRRVCPRYRDSRLRVALLLLLAQAVAANGLAAAARAAAPEVIVFLVPARLAADIKGALEDALAAQITLAGAKLVYMDAPEGAASLRAEVARNKRLAERHRAVGVFWLDESAGGEWFLNIMDARGEQVVVRSLAAESSSPETTVETVAVIARSATEALIEREAIDARLAERARQANARAELSTTLRLELGYSGTVFAPKHPWESGLALGLAYLWRSGPYLGLGYAWSPPIDVNHAEEAGFTVSRHPIVLRGGARIWPWDRWAVSAELGAGVELRSRHTTRAVRGLTAAEDSLRVVYLTSVGLTAEWQPFDWMSVVLRASPELVIRSFPYYLWGEESENSGARAEAALDPYILRFTGQLALTIIR